MRNQFSRATHGARGVTLLVLSAAMATLGGCSLMPNNINEPVISLHAQANGMKADYRLSKDSPPIVAGQMSDGDSGVLPVETTPVGVKSQIMALRGSYRSRQTELLREIDVASNFQFAGIIVSAIGVGIKSTGTRNTGAGAAGLATLWGDHYKLMVQATNYKTAADAMDCVYRDIDAIPDSFWSSAYDLNGTFVIPKDTFTDKGGAGKDATTAYDTLSKMFPTLNNNVYEIDQKLHANQASVTITAVQVSDIQNAVTSQVTAKAGAASAVPAIKAAAESQVASATTESGQKQAQLVTAKVKADTAGLKLTNFRNVVQEKNASLERLTTQKTEHETQMMSLRSAMPDLTVMEVNSKDSKRSQAAAQLKLSSESAFALTRQISQITSEKSVAENNQKQAETDAALASGELQAAQAQAEEAAKAAANARKFKDMITLGVVDTAIALPSNVSACLAAMGK
ncbi:MAG TPA: hypothetical protein VIF60_11655 [Burkholderiaceae bacterium]|jgi:hypothetical protein